MTGITVIGADEQLSLSSKRYKDFCLYMMNKHLDDAKHFERWASKKGTVRHHVKRAKDYERQILLAQKREDKGESVHYDVPYESGFMFQVEGFKD